VIRVASPHAGRLDGGPVKRKFPIAHPFYALRGRDERPGDHEAGKPMRDEERAVQLRELARRLLATPPSPNRDELLERTRLRLVEIEAHQELDPPTSLPPLPWRPV
jgi:hypothetical protein